MLTTGLLSAAEFAAAKKDLIDGARAQPVPAHDGASLSGAGLERYGVSGIPHGRVPHTRWHALCAVEKTATAPALLATRAARHLRRSPPVPLATCAARHLRRSPPAPLAKDGRARTASRARPRQGQGPYRPVYRP